MTQTTTPATAGPAQRLLDRIAALAIHIAVVALLGLVVVQGWQVFARYVVNDSPSWTEPVTLLLLSTAMSLGAACGVHTRRHFGFFLLAAYMGPALRRAVDVLGQLVIAVLGLALAVWSWQLLHDGLHIKTAGAALPQSINYLPLAVGGALMVLFALNHAWCSWTCASDHADAVEGDR
ncbi:TRAP transporter small permease [Stenotrophomonas sp. 24(2023)]|uniref:TRAP transporter small permease n=1 Tax=Stenotrophomonas sp. 24(2023) TaxID=3068324 RepID=UPI0027DF1BE6|nr:TRAP transporter small permease [Stenotrophomonas sp. 24(2023)]WMJ71124.1 TRAP transporter small permease [Stenotrophomonas sp. 24(2023)]